MNKKVLFFLIISIGIVVAAYISFKIEENTPPSKYVDGFAAEGVQYQSGVVTGDALSLEETEETEDAVK